MKNVAAYIRVSTQEQKLHGISLDAQRDKLKEYAGTHKMNIVAWYEDEGISGRKLIKKRPELQRMINDADQGKFEHIIFIKLDRFFRSVAEYHECMKKLGDVTWTATEEKYDLTTANGRAFVNMKLTIAELEADQTGERIRIVNEYKLKTGQPLTGSLPWSHKIVLQDNAKKIVVNEDNRANCVDVIDFYLRTSSLHRTLEYCSKFHSFYDIKGLKSWLTNTMLIGEYRGVSGYCEPLIDVSTFNQIQGKLANNVKHSSIGIPMFSRLLICPECGRKLSATTSLQKHNGKSYRYQKYRCDNNVQHRGCTNKLLYSENMIEKCLLDNLEPLVIKHTDYSFKERVNTIDVDKIKSEIERLNYMFEKGRISIQQYDLKYDDLQLKLKEANNENSITDNEQIEKLNSIIKQGWKDIYNELDKSHRSDFWHSILKKVEIFKSGRDYTVSMIIFN